MRGGWALALRRMDEQRLVVGSAFVTVVIALTLAAVAAVYPGSVARTAVQQVIGAAPVRESGLQVSAATTGSVASADTFVRRELARAYAPLRSETSLSLLSDGWKVWAVDRAAGGGPPGGLAA